MPSTSAYHAVLVSLLDKSQFDPCRMAVEDLIAQQMASPAPDDRELAALHLILCRALLGIHEYEAAALKAEFAALLAQKAKEPGLTAEAYYRAGICYGQARNYAVAVERFTDCLRCASDSPLRAKALFNRGHTYERQYAYAYAVGDYEEAIRTVADQDAKVARLCKINMAWDLIMLHQFDRGEQILADLAAEPDSGSDEYMQLQIDHDRLHMTHLDGKGREALTQAVAALRRAGGEYPEIKARIALTLMALSAEGDLPEQAFTLGILAKRLAGRAERPDVDEEANRQMQTLEFQTGIESLTQPLLRMGEVTQGSIRPRKAPRRGKRGAV